MLTNKSGLRPHSALGSSSALQRALQRNLPRPTTASRDKSVNYEYSHSHENGWKIFLRFIQNSKTKQTIITLLQEGYIIFPLYVDTISSSPKDVKRGGGPLKRLLLKVLGKKNKIASLQSSPSRYQQVSTEDVEFSFLDIPKDKPMIEEIEEQVHEIQEITDIPSDIMTKSFQYIQSSALTPIEFHGIRLAFYVTYVLSSLKKIKEHMNKHNVIRVIENKRIIPQVLEGLKFTIWGLHADFYIGGASSQTDATKVQPRTWSVYSSIGGDVKQILDKTRVRIKLIMDKVVANEASEQITTSLSINISAKKTVEKTKALENYIEVDRKFVITLNGHKIEFDKGSLLCLSSLNKHVFFSGVRLAYEVDQQRRYGNN
jgi:hypothetical protein